MKWVRYILILLLFSFPAHAVTVTIINVGGCADCGNNNASFIWECNSVTVGDTGYAPCGCSDGDTSATANSDATITSGACVFDDTVSEDGGDYYGFDNGADVLSDDTLFTVFIKFKVTTWIDNTWLFTIFGDADNKVIVRLSDSNDLEGIHEGNTDDDRVVLTGNNVSTGTDYIVRYRGQVGEAGNDHQISLYSASGTHIESITEDDDLTAFATQAGDGDFAVGNKSGVTSSNISIYYAHVYKEWRADDPN